MSQFARQVTAVLFGGALGAVCRVEAGRAVMSVVGGVFPLAYFASTCWVRFCWGCSWARPRGRSTAIPRQRPFWPPDFSAGFTTFSSFALDTVTLWGAGHAAFAVLNVGLNAALCIVLAGPRLDDCPRPGGRTRRENLERVPSALRRRHAVLRRERGRGAPRGHAQRSPCRRGEVHPGGVGR